tara:strand:+ start:1752 stop:3320 length:1569 start_codon:yes stop_codon:yes gene_type:complete
MAKAQLVTRATTSGTNTENLNKGSALTHAEMDKNLIGLRDAGFGIADDTSTVLSVTNDKTITIAGGTGITTALSGDTLTITNSGGDITSVVAGDGLANGGTTGDVTLNIGAGTGIDVAADAISVDVSDFMTNGSNNRVVTATGTDAMNAEANMTFDGSTLAVTGNITATTSIANDAVSISDNLIQASRSNDDLKVEPSSTGQVLVGAGTKPSDALGSTRWAHGSNLLKEDLALDPSSITSSGDRIYANTRFLNLKLTEGNGSTESNNSHLRFRQADAIQFDVNGQLLTAQNRYRGIQGNYNVQTVRNTSSNAGKISNVLGVMVEADVATQSSKGALTIDTLKGFVSSPYLQENSDSEVLTVSEIKHFENASDFDGTTPVVTDEYAYYAGTLLGTNKFAFFAADLDARSAIGKLDSYRESINALTNSATITVDCSLAPVHTVTIAQTGTQFNFKNLGTGQTATVVVKQDGTGNRTATFTEEDSTAIKFQGGAPTLSTGANAIDVITVFNTGSEVLGNCAKAYA